MHSWLDILDPDTCDHDAHTYYAFIHDPDTWCIYQCSLILDSDACVYDAHIYDMYDAYIFHHWPQCMYVWFMYLWSFILIHVCMMHVYMLLDIWPCCMHVWCMCLWCMHVWCISLILDPDKCMMRVCIYDPQSWCMYAWCIYPWSLHMW